MHKVNLAYQKTVCKATNFIQSAFLKMKQNIKISNDRGVFSNRISEK